MPRAAHRSLAVLFLASLGIGTAGAQPDCSPRLQPAATVLVPYFTVDLDDLDGATTLIAVGNVAAQPALARLTLWTDWGVPTLAFDLFLGPDAVQTINLRDVFNGVLPTTGGGSFEGCSNPLAKPPLGPAERARLRARHTGLPDPVDGRCYGNDRPDTQRAVGFVTADIMNRCPSATATPLDADYFKTDGSGPAGYSNQLYGDFFYADQGENFAQGNAAVHLVADVQRYPGFSFYSELVGDADDRRAPLGARHRTRYAVGGGFGGITDLVIFAQTNFTSSADGWVCGSDRNPNEAACEPFLQFTLRGESGQPQSVVTRPHEAVAASYRIGSPELPVPAPFGVVDVEDLTLFFCGGVPGGPVPLGSWVMPIQSASGRYSVGLEAIRTGADCRP